VLLGRAGREDFIADHAQFLIWIALHRLSLLFSRSAAGHLPIAELQYRSAFEWREAKMILSRSDGQRA
jgi:hypothetical protein